MNEIETFKDLAQKASDRFDQCLDVKEFVPFTSQMVEIARSNPNDRQLFAQAIVSFWEKPEIEVQIIEFLCHALMWQELESYFEQEREVAKLNEDWRAWQCADGIVKSFQPDWENADFYPEYFGN